MTHSSIMARCAASACASCASAAATAEAEGEEEEGEEEEEEAAAAFVALGGGIPDPLRLSCGSLGLLSDAAVD